MNFSFRFSNQPAKSLSATKVSKSVSFDPISKLDVSYNIYLSFPLGLLGTFMPFDVGAAEVKVKVFTYWVGFTS